jgi:hypothetical protein
MGVVREAARDGEEREGKSQVWRVGGGGRRGRRRISGLGRCDAVNGAV